MVVKFSNTVVAYALSLSSWGVIGADGILDQDLEIHTQCGDGSAAISTAIIPGTSTRTTWSSPHRRPPHSFGSESPPFSDY